MSKMRVAVGVGQPYLAGMDRLTPARRSQNMSRIRSKNTAPEMVVRRYLHAEGLRYRLHKAGLPGKPDLIFSGRRVVVFVHGCFWHGCRKCVDGTRAVKSNTTYWQSKIEGNQARDARNTAALEAAGWRVRTVWECELRQPGTLAALAGELRNLV